MTAPTPRPDKQQKVRGRRRAWLSMKILTALCALAAVGIGATQVASNGLQAFVTRPEGVGATPDAGPDGAPAAPQPGSPPRRTPATDPPVAVDPPANDVPSGEEPPRHEFPHDRSDGKHHGHRRG